MTTHHHQESPPLRMHTCEGESGCSLDSPKIKYLIIRWHFHHKQVERACTSRQEVNDFLRRCSEEMIHQVYVFAVTGPALQICADRQPLPVQYTTVFSLDDDEKGVTQNGKSNPKCQPGR